MKKFTDLLDAYLDADKDYKEARENFKGYDFDYFHHRIVERLRSTADELNEAFENRRAPLEVETEDLGAAIERPWQCHSTARPSCVSGQCRLPAQLKEKT